MQLAAPVFPEIVPRAAVLLVVLERDQRVEDEQNLRAHVGNRRYRDDEDEVVTADVSDEPAALQHSLDDVV